MDILTGDEELDKDVKPIFAGISLTKAFLFIDALMDFAEDPEDFRTLCLIHAETEDDRKLLSEIQNRLDMLEEMGS